MVIRLREVLFLTTLTTVALFATLVSQAAESVANPRRLPKNTVALATVRSLADFRAQFGQTSMARMLEDPAMKPFLEDLQSKLNDQGEQVRSALGMSLEELANIPTGEVTLAVTLGPNAGQFAATLFVDYHGQEEAFGKVLERINKGWDDLGITRTEEEIEGTPAYRLQIPETESPIKLVPAWSQKDGVFLFTTHTDALKSILARWDGAHNETLAESEVYQYIVDRVKVDGSEKAPLMHWFVDPLSMLKGGLSVDPNMAFQAAMAMGVIQQIGVDKIKAMGGSWDIAEGDFDGHSRTFLYAEPSNRGVMNLMSFDEGATGPPSWMSAEATSFGSTRWNLEKAYNAVEEMVDMFAGAGTMARQLDEMADSPETGRLHLKRDFIDNLSGAYQTYSDTVGEGDEARQRMLIAFEVKNDKAMKETMQKIANIEGFPGTSREFQGTTIYELPLEGLMEGLNVPNLTRVALRRQLLQAGVGGAGTGNMGMAISEQRMLMGFDVTILEQVLRGAGDRDTLAESPAYKRVTSRFPARAVSIGYTQGNVQLTTLLKALAEGPAQQLAGSAVAEMPFDVSKLPSDDQLRKYATPGGSYMELDDKGIRWSSFSLKSAQ